MIGLKFKIDSVDYHPIDFKGRRRIGLVREDNTAGLIPVGTLETLQEDPPATHPDRNSNRLPIQPHRPLGILEFSRAQAVELRYDATT